MSQSSSLVFRAGSASHEMKTLLGPQWEWIGFVSGRVMDCGVAGAGISGRKPSHVTSQAGVPVLVPKDTVIAVRGPCPAGPSQVQPLLLPCQVA
jgi:hypothetical protein